MTSHSVSAVRRCPYCVAHLEHLREVVGHIKAAGGQLVAISPMPLDNLADTPLDDFLVPSHPGVELRVNHKSISPRCHLFEVGTSTGVD